MKFPSARSEKRKKQKKKPAFYPAGFFRLKSIYLIKGITPFQSVSLQMVTLLGSLILSGKAGLLTYRSSSVFAFSHFCAMAF